MVRTRRMQENWRIYALFGCLKLRNWIIGRLPRCFFHHNHRRCSCLHTGNCFHLRFTFYAFMFLHVIQHAIHLFGFLFSRSFSTFLASFKFKFSFRFLSPIWLCSGCISLNRHSASSAFYPTLVILESSTIVIRNLYYLPQNTWSCLTYFYAFRVDDVFFAMLLFVPLTSPHSFKFLFIISTFLVTLLYMYG